MKNITGPPVTDKDYLKTRRFLVKRLKELVKDCSVIIEAPRRYGKTSIIKELMHQEEKKDKKNRKLNTIFLELEGEKSVQDFCFRLYGGLLVLYWGKRKIDALQRLFGKGWNALAARLKKLKIPELEIELREKTRDYSFDKWKEIITPMIAGLNAFELTTIIAFDEFPDMLMNFKKKSKDETAFKDTVDDLTAWLRSLRQSQSNDCKYRFVFCGSINLRKTLEDMGISKRINDLEPFVIPPITKEDATLLIEMLSRKYKLKIEPEGMAYMVSKITGGSLFYGQIFVKALIEKGKHEFSISSVRAIYETLLRNGNHDMNHYHSRLEEYLTGIEKECSGIILKQLCSEIMHEQEIFDLFLHDKCPYTTFQAVVNRLIYEGYITRDIEDSNKLKFIAPILRDWWGCKVGVPDVCI